MNDKRYRIIAFDQLKFEVTRSFMDENVVNSYDNRDESEERAFHVKQQGYKYIFIQDSVLDRSYPYNIPEVELVEQVVLRKEGAGEM